MNTSQHAEARTSTQIHRETVIGERHQHHEDNTQNSSGAPMMRVIWLASIACGYGPSAHH
ncbi:hypothetical protein EYF80_043182 [Liparis tanakae]|uniref:Uncharacterized protein n=1 Tax=Liparis tanakae TaxID=230148 RepID=A0A4Z2FZG6_9TELE|nr:hypothetical protein EYF80_043182 [Liparis tanakae]